MSAAASDSHVLSEDGCPLLWRHRHEVNPASVSLTNDRVTMRSLDVLHPIGFRAEHRHEVTFALHGGDDHGVRASVARYATIHFENGLALRRQAEAGPPTAKAVDPSPKTRGAPVAVKQPQESALGRVEMSRSTHWPEE